VKTLASWNSDNEVRVSLVCSTKSTGDARC